MFQLDGTHIVTIEGLAKAGGLSGIQQAMVDCHGSQCGFCTPGFVMTMTGMHENGCAAQADNLKYGLTGNLCRCTGYVSIIEAGLAASNNEQRRLAELFPPAPLLEDFAAHADEDLRLPIRQKNRSYCPATLDGALEYLDANPQSMIVSGATDLGVRVNKGLQLPDVIARS